MYRELLNYSVLLVRSCILSDNFLKEWAGKEAVLLRTKQSSTLHAILNILSFD